MTGRGSERGLFQGLGSSLSFFDRRFGVMEYNQIARATKARKIRKADQGGRHPLNLAVVLHKCSVKGSAS